jgi:zinc transport system substrate-binding protein
MQLPIEAEGKEPKPTRLRELIEYTKKNNIRVVFVQPQFSSKSAKIIANAIGGQVGFVDPLHRIGWAICVRWRESLRQL